MVSLISTGSITIKSLMLLINGFIEKLNVFPTWLYVIEVLFPTSDLNLKSPTSILAIAYVNHH